MKRPKLVQTNTSLRHDTKKLLQDLKEKHDGTLEAADDRAIRGRHSLLQGFGQQAAEIGGENGRLLMRLAVELGPEWLVVSRELRYIDEDETAHDGPGIEVGEHIFFEDEGGVLHATKTDGSIFRVEDGRLHLIAVIPATNGGSGEAEATGRPEFN